MIGYERQGQAVIPNDFGTNYGLQFGIPEYQRSGSAAERIPEYRPGSYTTFGVPNWMPVTRVEESYTHSDNLTYTHGAHELRFGFDPCGHPEPLAAGDRERPAVTCFGGGPTALNGARLRTSTTDMRRTCWGWTPPPTRACNTSSRPAANGSLGGMRAIDGRSRGISRSISACDTSFTR